MTTHMIERPSRRRRSRDRRVEIPSAAQVEFAAQTVDDLAHNRPVFVSVDGHGGGWCVTAVDVYAFTYDVWRDRQSMTVAWAAVSQ
ncbi:hypothetical protein [Plantactinospora sp. WMMB782]|uniref:hypothetical protein n=1 Tax=Plantactinospora sp. WMMB782 TaxID=3404121 RepID=UPI003B9642DD